MYIISRSNLSVEILYAIATISNLSHILHNHPLPRLSFLPTLPPLPGLPLLLAYQTFLLRNPLPPNHHSRRPNTLNPLIYVTKRNK